MPKQIQTTTRQNFAHHLADRPTGSYRRFPRMCHKAEQVIEYDDCCLKPSVLNNQVPESGPASAESNHVGLPVMIWVLSLLRNFRVTQLDPSTDTSAADPVRGTGATAMGAPNNPNPAPMDLLPHRVTWVKYILCGRATRAHQADDGLEEVSSETERKFVCRVPEPFWGKQFSEENIQREASHVTNEPCPVCRKMGEAEKKAQTMIVFVCDAPKLLLFPASCLFLPFSPSGPANPWNAQQGGPEPLPTTPTSTAPTVPPPVPSETAPPLRHPSSPGGHGGPSRRVHRGVADISQRRRDDAARNRKKRHRDVSFWKIFSLRWFHTADKTNADRFLFIHSRYTAALKESVSFSEETSCKTRVLTRGVGVAQFLVF